MHVEEKARPDVNQTRALCFWFCFGSSLKVISQQCADSMSLLRVSSPSCVNKLLSSLPAKADRARWRAVTVRQANRVWNGSQRFSSPSNMQCVLSSPYLISSHLQWQRCVCVRACKCVCAFVVAFLSERGQHNVSCFSLISFCVSRATDRAALDIPIILLSRDVFFGMTHRWKSPKLHLSCSLKLSSLTEWPH